MTDKELEEFIHHGETGFVAVAMMFGEGWAQHAIDIAKELRARLAQGEPEPVAWRTFDGEGNYEFRDYEMNECYAEEWAKRNPNHAGWVEPLYADPTPCHTCESLARTVMMDQTSHDTAPPQREWQGLTDEEIRTAAFLGIYEKPLIEFARAIEAKLKEKNS